MPEAAPLILRKETSVSLKDVVTDLQAKARLPLAPYHTKRTYRGVLRRGPEQHDDVRR